jgi:hypothetical protein
MAKKCIVVFDVFLAIYGHYFIRQISQLINQSTLPPQGSGTNHLECHNVPTVAKGFRHWIQVKNVDFHSSSFPSP